MQNFMVTLLICSVAMSVLALVYMAVTPFLAKRYSEKWRYYAWLVIMVGLIVPFRPQSGNALVSVEVPPAPPPLVFQINGETPVGYAPSQHAPLIPPTLPPLLPTETTVPYGTTLNVSRRQIAAAVWLFGVLVFAVKHGVKHYRFAKTARRWGKIITDAEILSLFESLKAEMGVKRRIPIYLCPFAGSPMMIGLFRPRILLPSAELSHDELCFVLKHELVHYKRKDLLYKYLVLASTALHWFNPVVYLMARAVNSLCETSCDAEILRSADINTRLLYGETIIGMAQHQSRLKTALSTNFYGGKNNMKNRILSIMDTRKKKAGTVIACAVLALVAGTGFIFAANTAAPEPPETPCIIDILHSYPTLTSVDYRQLIGRSLYDFPESRQLVSDFVNRFPDIVSFGTGHTTPSQAGDYDYKYFYLVDLDNNGIPEVVMRFEDTSGSAYTGSNQNSVVYQYLNGEFRPVSVNLNSITADVYFAENFAEPNEYSTVIPLHIIFHDRYHDGTTRFNPRNPTNEGFNFRAAAFIHSRELDMGGYWCVTLNNGTMYFTPSGVIRASEARG